MKKTVFGVNSMQAYEKTMGILLKEANPAIKYRIIGGIYNGGSTTECLQLKSKLQNIEKAKQLLVYLENKKEYHGATLYAAENSINMLVDMGYTYGLGFVEFDRILKSLVQEVKMTKVEGNHVLRYLPNIVMIPFLLRAGIRENWMIDFIKERIDVIYSFIKERNYDIYDDEIWYRGIPNNFKGRPIIRPELYEDGQIKLPLEYDIYGFASIRNELLQHYKNKVDEIITYIMEDKFRQIADGYGVLSNNKKYWALGWDPKPTDLEKEYLYNPLLLKMELLSNFEIATQKEWFLQALELVETYKDENGLYHYPKNYLTEKNSCWILGNHMGIGENRRNRNAIVYEGTFRTLIIKNNLKKFCGLKP